MKFHEALAASQTGPATGVNASASVSTKVAADIPRELVQGEAEIWLVHADAANLSTGSSDPLATGNTGKALIAGPAFVDVDLSQLVFDEGPNADPNGEIHLRSPQGGLSTPLVAMPALLRHAPFYPGLSYPQAYPFTFATQLNGRWWGFNPHANCRTSTTTTRPPCNCTQRYNDLQVTISGVGTQPQCSGAGVAGSCNALNRTWCLYFQSTLGFQCTWASNSVTWWPCGVAQSLQLSLRFPSAYYPSGPATPSDCQSAELLIGGVVAYKSNAFSPSTGGTFTLVSGNQLVFTCTNLPATVTVSASANCTTTTTTTTSTTSTSTSTSTSTTPAPTCGQCYYTWFFSSWFLQLNGCDAGSGCNCVEPPYNGQTQYELAITNCQ